MKKLKLLILLLTVLITSNAQKPKLTPEDYDLLNFAIKDRRYAIKLVAQMTEYNLMEIKKYIDRGVFYNRMVDENDNDISDSIVLTKLDKKIIYRKLTDIKSFEWTNENAKKLNLDNIDVISYDTSISNNWTYAIKYHIVPPIYFGKEKQFCLLSFSYSCGGLCGHGQITIFQKTDKGWKRWNHLSWWDE